MTSPAAVPGRAHWSDLTMLALVLALPIFGLVARPYGCAWGTNAYGYAGLAVMVLGLVLPWIRRVPWMRRLQRAVAWGFVALVAAVAGLFAADLPLLCP